MPSYKDYTAEVLSQSVMMEIRAVVEPDKSDGIQQLIE